MALGVALNSVSSHPGSKVAKGAVPGAPKSRRRGRASAGEVVSEVALPEGELGFVSAGKQSAKKSLAEARRRHRSQARAGREEGVSGGVGFAQQVRLREGNLTFGWQKRAGGSNLGLRGAETARVTGSVPGRGSGPPVDSVKRALPASIGRAHFVRRRGGSKSTSTLRGPSADRQTIRQPPRGGTSVGLPWFRGTLELPFRKQLPGPLCVRSSNTILTFLHPFVEVTGLKKRFVEKKNWFGIGSAGHPAQATAGFLGIFVGSGSR